MIYKINGASNNNTIIFYFVFLGPGCLPSDGRSGGEDFSPGSHSPPISVAMGAVVAVMEVEGDMEVPLI